MQYLCEKQLTAGGVAYHPGEIIPDGVILPERSGKLLRMGYICEMNTETPQGYVAELQEIEPGAYEGTVIIPVKGDNEQQTAVPVTPEEIQQVFGIMQMNATDGAEAIAGVKSENILILLHAADTRKTIKDATKKQADNIFSTSGSPNESTGGNAITGTNTEGADT